MRRKISVFFYFSGILENGVNLEKLGKVWGNWGKLGNSGKIWEIAKNLKIRKIKGNSGKIGEIGKIAKNYPSIVPEKKYFSIFSKMAKTRS